MNVDDVLALGLRSADSQTNVPSPSFTKIYANNVTMSMSVWDMSLMFGEIIAPDADGKPVVEQKVKVNLSKEFAKALRNLLVTNIKAYEEQFGEIKLTNKLVAELRALNENVEDLQSMGKPRLAPKRSNSRKKD